MTKPQEGVTLDDLLGFSFHHLQLIAIAFLFHNLASKSSKSWRRTLLVLHHEQHALRCQEVMSPDSARRTGRAVC